jgi:hypothetical protein
MRGGLRAPAATDIEMPAKTTLKAMFCSIAAALAFAACGAFAAEFGTPGGPPPANLDEITRALRADPYDLELLISFGTSKGGSAGHLALAVRGEVPGDDIVYSANFYADGKHDDKARYYSDELMVRIPKMEYLYGTTSSLGPTGSFGLDFGEVYKRSVIGVRVYGVPATEKQALAAFFQRLNDDYRRNADGTDYHDKAIKYDYLRLNCAKTIGLGFKVGAGYDELDVTSAKLFSRRRVVAAANANIPTEMAMKLLQAWNARGYALDALIYRKYPHSPYVDPHDDDAVAFKDLPNRFPSVLSRDFRKEQGRYEDYDNLVAMYLLTNLAKYSVRVDRDTKLLEIDRRKDPMAYATAVAAAERNAKSDSENFRRRLSFRPGGTAIEDDPPNARR